MIILATSAVLTTGISSYWLYKKLSSPRQTVKNAIVSHTSALAVKWSTIFSCILYLNLIQGVPMFFLLPCSKVIFW